MINQEAVNLYLEANGITVIGNTDNYYRLSGDVIKEWSNAAPQPSLQDLAPHETTVSLGHHISLADYKAQTILNNQTEAGVRIAALFGTTYGTDTMRDRQANNLKRYLLLREKEQSATITSPEQTELDALRTKDAAIDAIRAAENATVTPINNAADKPAVDLITPTWP